MFQMSYVTEIIILRVQLYFKDWKKFWLVFQFVLSHRARTFQNFAEVIFLTSFHFLLPQIVCSFLVIFRESNLYSSQCCCFQLTMLKSRTFDLVCSYMFAFDPLAQNELSCRSFISFKELLSFLFQALLRIDLTDMLHPLALPETLILKFATNATQEVILLPRALKNLLKLACVNLSFL